jgi:hypothetical protein
VPIRCVVEDLWIPQTEHNDNPLNAIKIHRLWLLTMDRVYSFYKSLLVNNTTTFLQSHAEKAKSEELLQKISAHFLDLPPMQKKQRVDISPDDPWTVHMKRLRLLILEESRHTIAEALHRRWNQSRYQNSLRLEVQFEEVKEGTPSVVQCRRGVFKEDDIKLSRYFTAQDINDLMRPGAIVELYPVKGGKISVDQVFLGTISHQVWTVTDKNRRERSVRIPKTKAIELYANGNGLPKDGSYKIYPLTSLLSYDRQMQASYGLKPDLYPDLMLTLPGLTSLSSYAPQMEASYGLKPDLYPDLMSTLPKNAAALEITEEDPAEESDDLLGGDSYRSADAPPTKEAMSHFIIPQLNACQEKASTEFLTSPSGSIILVQGCVQIFVYTFDNLISLSPAPQFISNVVVGHIRSPPGTGKSTMLIATICKFLQQQEAAERYAQPRLMVCAPSNKAVTVLAARYLEADKTSPFRAIMVGDKDKMLSEDRLRFKDIFIYTWVENMVKDLKSICQISDRNKARTQGEALEKRLYDGIPEYALRSERGVQALMQRLLDSVSSFEKGKADESVKKLTRRLWEIERDIQGVLLQKANVIFCTLSSAGATIVRRTDPVEGLIIDEAAASVEPETYIPMALGPKRIMIVGDPKQLPATIMSQHAKVHGLAKSLQERLMFDESRPYTMLKVQYRMRPEISRFPSKTFYEGGISDGSNVTNASYHVPEYRTLVSDQPYSFIQVDGTETQKPSGSFENMEEAERVVAILMDLRKISTGSRETFAIDRVRVITFYQAQVELISNMLKANGLQQVTVSTVDSSQGSEADLVLLSFVRTGKTKGVGFLSDNRRLNVALTRAKHKLICIGNLNYLAEVKGRGTTTIRSLAKDSVDREIVSNYIPKVKVVRPHQTWVPSRNSNSHRGQKRDRNPTRQGQQLAKRRKKS